MQIKGARLLLGMRLYWHTGKEVYVEALLKLICFIEESPTNALIAVACSVGVYLMARLICEITNEPVRLRNGFYRERTCFPTMLVSFAACAVMVLVISLSAISCVKKGGSTMVAAFTQSTPDTQYVKLAAEASSFLGHAKQDYHVSYGATIADPKKELERFFGKSPP